MTATIVQPSKAVAADISAGKFSRKRLTGYAGPNHYEIEEKPCAPTPHPFSSPLSITAHAVTWICWAWYLIQRFPGFGAPLDGGLSIAWIVYLCELAFLLPDLQAAVELSFSLLAPRLEFGRPRYVLRGKAAPTVHIFVT